MTLGVGDTIFLLSNTGQPIELTSALFGSEDELQDLLARYPGLLAGAQMTPGDPRRWMLVRREMGVPSREGGGNQWSADHLFLDQDAVPTIVEVKRSTDSDIRRKVVGQMLDYAANAVRYWPVERLRAVHEAESPDPQGDLERLLGPGADPDAFWARVGDHLATGRIRMVFVADMVPPELQRIVEFLNEGMTRAQVYAVEVPLYVGGEHRSLVPRLIGATAAARQSSARDQASPGVEALLAAAPDHVRIVDELLRAWAAASGVRVRDTSSGRQLGEGDVSYGMFYPGWATLEIYLSPIRDAGFSDEAAEIFTAMSALCPSKRLTEVSPNLPTADLSASWDSFAPVLERYRAARKQAAMRRLDRDLGGD